MISEASVLIFSSVEITLEHSRCTAQKARVALLVVVENRPFGFVEHLEKIVFQVT